jgi:hypothetical protein
MSRVQTKTHRGRIVAAETGTCARCGQPIAIGERMANERGHASHRDCIRLHVAIQKPREPQASLGWGSACHICGEVIERPSAWRKFRGKVMHATC